MSNEEPKASISLVKIKGGDREEFGRMVDIYSGPIYRLASQMLGDDRDAEDILQETFIKAYRNLTTFEGRSKLSTWLYRIAVNEVLMLRRKRYPDQVSIDEDIENQDGDIEPRQIIDWCCLPEHELLSVETRKVMDEAVQHLPPTLRIVFVLRDIDGLSVQETADALNVNEGVVKTRLLRARLRLRESLSSYFSEKN
jgi:RNA polymerase sigma-70 factor, ECF subfamily